MEKVYVVYWSQTGNTEEMANYIKEGIENAGKEAEVVEVSNASVDELKSTEGFILGCPATGSESLEEEVMEPFVCEVEKFAAGKVIGLFGSYGWGGGQWMEEWTARMKAAGATVPGDAGVTCMDAPDDEAKEACRKLGEQLAQL